MISSCLHLSEPSAGFAERAKYIPNLAQFKIRQRADIVFRAPGYA